MGLCTTRARPSPRLGRRTDRLWALGREGAGGCQFSGEDPGLVTAQPEGRTPCLLGTGRSRPACGVCGGRSPVQYRLSQQMGCLWVQEPRHANPGREQRDTLVLGQTAIRGPPASTYHQGELLELYFQLLLLFFQTAPLPLQLLNFQPARRETVAGYPLQPSRGSAAPGEERGTATR